MLTRQKSIDNFKMYMDDLINSGFILVDSKLTNLMRSISTSSMFYSLFEYCTEDFDYESAFALAFRKGEGYGNGRFILPPEAKNQIALIFSLLYQINTKELNFLNLLEHFFFVNDYADSYRNFAAQVLIPFRTEVLRAVAAMSDTGASVQEPQKAPSHTAVEIKTVNEDDAKTIIALLDESRSIILQYKIDAALKGEIVDLYQNFKDSIYDGDCKTIRIAYLGYKYATLYHRKLDGTMLKIEKLLKKNGVL